MAADYFRRGVFNTYKVITTEKSFVALDEVQNVQKKKQQRGEKKVGLNYGAGAEAKIRQVENARGKAAAVAVPEGRMRVQEMRGGYSGSLEANITKGKNPFESDYDESKNPFNEGENGENDDEDYDDKNPFKDDYDCDKNLNPFN